jgi:hypothetical protein
MVRRIQRAVFVHSTAERLVLSVKTVGLVLNHERTRVRDAVSAWTQVKVFDPEVIILPKVDFAGIFPDYSSKGHRRIQFHSRDQSLSYGIENQLREIMQLKFLEYVTPVGFDGCYGHAQEIGNFPIGLAGCQAV